MTPARKRTHRGSSAALKVEVAALLLALLAIRVGLGGEKPEFLRYTVTGEVYGDYLGKSLAALGDLDGDGVPDFAASSIEYRVVPGSTGKVLLLSGKTGEVIRTLRSDEPWLHYGLNLASAGDFDGDGVSDVLAGGPYFLEARSGRTGEVLSVVRDRTYDSGGLALVGVGDVNLDGVPDFAVANRRPEDSYRARVHVYSGDTGSILWTIDRHEREVFGADLEAVGDVDQDGIPDLAVSSLASPLGDDRAGRVQVLRGQDGAEIYALRLEVPQDGFGSSLAALSDVDGDGVRELAVGATGFPVRGLRGGGWVGLHSGRTGKLLWSQTGQDFGLEPPVGAFSGDALGASVASAGDADGDGFEDVLAWSERAAIAGQDFGRVSLFSGQTGDLLATYEREVDDTVFGSRLSRLGDIDGDGRAEFLIAAPEYSLPRPPPPREWQFDVGRVYAVSYIPSGRLFIRGDTDLDGDVDITDGVVILNHLFHGGPAPCEEAMDINRNQTVNVSDPIYIFAYLFGGRLAPEPPFPECGRLETFRPGFPCERSFCDR